MAVQGVFMSDSNIEGTRAGDFASAILQTSPTGSSPLLALTSGMEFAPAKDTIVTWFEENHLSGRVNITNNAGTGTTIVVDDGTQFVAGAFGIVEATGEFIYIDSVFGNTLTVTRGFAGTTVTAVDGSGTPSPFQRIGTAYEQGSSRPESIANIGKPVFNYVQTFRNAWSHTGTAKAIENVTGNVVAKNRRDAASFHAEDIERSIIWGRKSVGVKNGRPFYTMDGIQSQIKTNVTVAAGAGGGDVSWKDLDTFLQNVFSRNIVGKPNERIAFCGNGVLSTIQQIAVLQGGGSNGGYVELKSGQTEFGLEITTWRSPYGTIKLMTHPLMNESQYWTYDLMVLHPGAMRTRYLRQTHEDAYDSDGSRAGVDADFGVITTEMCVEYRAEITGAIYKNMKNGIAGI